MRLRTRKIKGVIPGLQSHPKAHRPEHVDTTREKKHPVAPDDSGLMAHKRAQRLAVQIRRIIFFMKSGHFRDTPFDQPREKLTINTTITAI